MGMVLQKLYGMQTDLGARLRARGIRETDDLLRACHTPAELMRLAEATGTDSGVLAQLVHRADLTKIRGIGEAYILLLEEAGIHTTHDLAAASPDDLRARFATINTRKRVVGRVPALAMVNGWVSKARRRS